MAKQYYLSNNGTHIGPYTHETILKKIEAQENQWTDYVYDETVGEWLMLLEHPEFAAKLAQKPSARPGKMAAPVPSKQTLKDKEWFILKEGNNYGPFCQLEIIQMLQEKALFEYDYIWHAKLPAWKRVAELEEFSSDKIRSMRDSKDADVAEIFFRRRHARASYGASLIVHNNKTVFRGQALEISAGGAGVLIDTPNLQPGQSLFLHFQPGDGVPPFNAVCQIVSKQFVKDAKTDTEPVKYGVKFTTLSQSVRESIKNFTTKAA
ncbi:GYF domain-containing protein [Bdellovibrio sp. 22V]|uniref:GYF domain-containing protein n=1 Tax=Bdellovibrio sp. 22V TaxID=3044166 RepID=UPI0025429465|nr:GYF domain-containing protein [Bdellovibrio sp. 22V]WII72916.1 GYF domain-containing protein [Bdellovibrio sp. 22V]